MLIVFGVDAKCVCSLARLTNPINYRRLVAKRAFSTLSAQLNEKQLFSITALRPFETFEVKGWITL